ncbi:G protein-activated inward rectifier potassium channel 3-like [Anneissia japonica]|uniref:G protein-activated inward rectifier potassium channel 3-like n=1 Tax=Anneissia japonica TaxID=1529436 RepID=UPI001425A5E5|nr:G protein-activated inward rectifier potassium channel 3-like [Anneissia japonica]XP_033117740.1 G protein-activated inward rectifier potassium channel 3-like [Anneissia japonica]
MFDKLAYEKMHGSDSTCKLPEADRMMSGWRGSMVSSASSSDVECQLSESQPEVPNHHSRKESMKSYKLRKKLKRRKQMQRLVSKDGWCNVMHTHVKYRGIWFIADLFTTLVDLRWRYNLLTFTLAYVLGWFGFGLIWLIIAAVHGDLGHSELYPNDTVWEPCVTNVETFTGAFLFSLETQTTIGYGFRSVTEQCPVAVILVIIQSVVSSLVDAVMIGCIFAKIARPKKRAATLKFSRNAVIALRDEKLCFMFRVGDIRESHLFEAHLRAYMIKPRVTAEKEIIPLYQYNLDLNYETGEDRIFLVWPLIVSHTIDEDSPLYTLSAKDLDSADFEIVVILEGIVEQTGLTTQARTSYLPSEIQWGHRFCSSVIAIHSENDNQYDINYSKFELTYSVPETPKYSAQKLDELQRKEEDEEINSEPALDLLKKLIRQVLLEERVKAFNETNDSHQLKGHAKVYPRLTNGNIRSASHGNIKELEKGRDLLPKIKWGSISSNDIAQLTSGESINFEEHLDKPEPKLRKTSRESQI